MVFSQSLRLCPRISGYISKDNYRKVFFRCQLCPSALRQKKKAKARISPFVTSYHTVVSNLKQILMQQWSLIQSQPLLKTLYLKFPTISYKRDELLDQIFNSHTRRPPKKHHEFMQACHSLFPHTGTSEHSSTNYDLSSLS